MGYISHGYDIVNVNYIGLFKAPLSANPCQWASGTIKGGSRSQLIKP